jgi:hypothetical protein
MSHRRVARRQGGPEPLAQLLGSGRRTLSLPDVSRRNSNQHGRQDDQYCRLQPETLGKGFVEDLHVHRWITSLRAVIREKRRTSLRTIVLRLTPHRLQS